jgi:CheY-like chemotaxis protein/HPt (histidine-containing phosphotransfer) domain-containing protein
VVDDNEVNQKVAARLLQQMGYRAELAGNGLEAIMALRLKKYDLVFMDLQMPEMDGLEATRCIRTLQQTGELSYVPCIIAMTANVLASDRQACREAGMDDFVPKPIQAEKLQKMLEQWGTAARDARNSGSAGSLPRSKPFELIAANLLDTPVDLERLKSFTDGSRENMVELVTLYLDQTSKQIEDFCRAAKSGDLDAAKKLAHTASGSSATCGVNHLSILLREAERLAASNAASELLELSPKVDTEFKRVEKFLRGEFTLQKK